MFGINFGYTKDPDNYYFNNKNKFELIFFDTNEETGFFIALTNIKKKLVNFYDYKNDKIIQELGYKRVVRKYTLVNSWKFLINDSKITKSFK